MAKLYTLDNKLLTETPEIRIGEKVYAVDNRKSTVSKITGMMKHGDGAENGDEKADEGLKLALGEKAFREIDAMNLPFPAYQRLFELVMAAMTGEEVEAVEKRFQDTGKNAD